MTDEWQDADWNLFAMGALDETTQRAMQEHLRTQCRACNRSYREAVLVMDALAATVPQENPSPQVADALLARISKPTTPVISIAALPFRPRPVLPWVAAAACALLALWLGVRLEQVSTPAPAAPCFAATGRRASPRRDRPRAPRSWANRQRGRLLLLQQIRPACVPNAPRPAHCQASSPISNPRRMQPWRSLAK